MSRPFFSALLLTYLGAVAGCDRSVTSVGAWEPPSAGDEGGAPGEQPSDGQYLEAESGNLSGGFVIGADAKASNGAYLLAPEDAVADDAVSPAIARYIFKVTHEGDYVIWGRIYSPDIYTNRFHVQVDGGARYLWRITVGDIWYWDDVHDDVQYERPLRFALTSGTHELVVGNVAAGARLDRLYIAESGASPPGNDTPCRPPHSVELNGVCHDSCGAQATAERATTCSCDGRPVAELFEAYDCVSGSCCFVEPMP